MLVVDPSHIRRWEGSFSIGAPEPGGHAPVRRVRPDPGLRLRRWWTLLSAGWLHGGLLHIGFNLYWIRFLAPETAELYGPARTVIIYSISSITGFLASSLLGVPLTLGASAPILGLLGALVYYGRRTGSSVVGRMAWSYAIFMIVFGFLMPRRGQLGPPRRLRGRLPGGRPARPPQAGDRAITPWRRWSAWALTVASIVASLVVPVPGLR